MIRRFALVPVVVALLFPLSLAGCNNKAADQPKVTGTFKELQPQKPGGGGAAPAGPKAGAPQ